MREGSTAPLSSIIRKERDVNQKNFFAILCSLALGLVITMTAMAEDKPAPVQSPTSSVKAAPAAPTATVPAAPAPAPAVVSDPSGANTGVASDVVGGSANAPTQDELDKLGKTEPLAAKVADVVGHNRISINMVWTLVAGFLVMFMQAGFAMAETGFTRAKNAGHTMAMNFMVYGLGMLGYWICGFALQMGGVGGVAALGGCKASEQRIRRPPVWQGLRPVRHERVLPLGKYL